MKPAFLNKKTPPAKKQPEKTSKIKSTDDIVAYRKKKFGC